ncbi:UNVERIFIED_CONTAM: hypothetical protein Scaly_2611900 [Sesamum calycinum]|uniref:Retrotransposon gag domain-containing protein n=1 Tax=Sesamum calycinum TaxID=2727403 RepID=A0AAW2JEK8_9LAMI
MGRHEAKFLQRFFPASRATHLRKEIYGIRQLNGELLYEYWERFKELVASYPHHQLTESLLIQYFYEGLSRMDRRMVDAASGGALIDKTPNEAQNLISTMAENYKQYGYHTDKGAPRVNEVSTNDLAEKLSELTAFVHQLAAGQRQGETICGICSNTRHPMDACPSLLEGVMPNVNTVGGFPGQPQWSYDPTLISTIRDGETTQTSVKINASNQNHISSPSTGLPQHLHRPCLSRQTQLEAQAFGKLPSQTITNPRENVSAITLRSRMVLQPAGATAKKARIERNALDDIDALHDKVDSNLIPPPPSNTSALSFPYRMSKSKEEEHEREILDIFKKVEINILLLDAIKQIPKYAKFLKELCTNRRKLKDK